MCVCVLLEKMKCSRGLREGETFCAPWRYVSKIFGFASIVARESNKCCVNCVSVSVRLVCMHCDHAL